MQVNTLFGKVIARLITINIISIFAVSYSLSVRPDAKIDLIFWTIIKPQTNAITAIIQKIVMNIPFSFEISSFSPSTLSLK